MARSDQVTTDTALKTVGEECAALAYGAAGQWFPAGHHDYELLAQDIAMAMHRGMLAAAEEEREACAALADTFELDDRQQETEFVNKHSGYGWDAGFDAGCTLLSRAIRNRS